MQASHLTLSPNSFYKFNLFINSISLLCFADLKNSDMVAATDDPMDVGNCYVSLTRKPSISPKVI